MKKKDLTILLKQRYSCRNYLSDEINDEDIEKILYDGTLAPSTNNRQPWTFAVIKNKEIKNSISKMLKEKGLENNNKAFMFHLHMKRQ